MLEFIKYNEINDVVVKDESRQWISMASYDELPKIEGILGIKPEYVSKLMYEDGCRFESYDGFDLISIQIMDAKQPQAQKQHVCIYLRKNLLVFIGKYGEYLSDAVEKIKESKIHDMGVDDMLYYILDIIVSDDFDALEFMEDKIAFLEESVVTDRRKKCIREVMGFRRDLREMKKFYQQMYIICTQILENENGVISPGTIKYFKTIRSKLDRLMNMVISLRDYVSQVREAYQSQVDISQNNIMRFFTVITSIFLPMTLIVGWYGMNLKMPEFEWEYGYLYVIILSAIMVSSLVVYFKKRKWF